MKIATLLAFSCIFINISIAQTYHVTTNQQDQFSRSLVEILNAASTRFSNQKGDSLRSTSLMDTDYRLNIPVPGSAIAIVRIRDWDKNVYIEWRGFANSREQEQGMASITNDIKKALGHQLDIAPSVSKSFTSMGIRNSLGNFSPNMELMASSSSAEPYLLGPEREDQTLPKKYFILLKISGGIPFFHYLVDKGIKPTDMTLHKTIQTLMQAAKNDFEIFPWKSTGKKSTDTLNMDGYMITLYKRRQNYQAVISFTKAAGEAAARLQWERLHLSAQAALGGSFVYFKSQIDNAEYIRYYSKKYETNSPRLKIEQRNDNTILLIVESGFSHPTKRSLTAEDFE